MLLTFMLGCVVMLGLGTLNGWRTGITSGTELDRLDRQRFHPADQWFSDLVS